MPNYQKEIECFKKAVIVGKDEHGKKVTTTWPRDRQPGEQPYYEWLKKATDDAMKYNPALNEDGSPVKGTGAKHIVNQIIRVKTAKGEFLVTNGTLTGYDHNGNPIKHTCRHPEEWMETKFNFVRSVDNTGRTRLLCTGPNGFEIHYTMPFNLQSLKKLAELRAGDNIPFVLLDETMGDKPIGIPTQGSIEDTIKFFMQDFDYLYTGKYVSREQKLLNMRYAELLKKGKTEDQARDIIESEMEDGNVGKSKPDKKSGVA